MKYIQHNYSTFFFFFLVFFSFFGFFDFFGAPFLDDFTLGWAVGRVIERIRC